MPSPAQSPSKIQTQLGISLLEIILALAAVFILALIINNLPSSISSINKSRHASIARDVATKQIDYLRSLKYANLPDGTNNFSDQKLNSLSGVSSTYEVEVCPETICSSSEQTKTVKVIITWNESGDTKKVELTTLVSEGGLAQ